MAAKEVKTRIRNKYDLEVNWMRAENFIPLAGELIIYGKEIDPNTGDVLRDAENNPLLPADRSEPYDYDRFKFGDGKTNLNNLDFSSISPESVISCGMSDPDSTITSKFYFKYGDNI